MIATITSTKGTQGNVKKGLWMFIPIMIPRGSK